MDSLQKTNVRFIVYLEQADQHYYVKPLSYKSAYKYRTLRAPRVQTGLLIRLWLSIAF